MVKIGMTRRLDPMERVNELGDARVPFRFDVHALFFADDAVAIESMLHQEFAKKRVNKVNMRREFFYCTPAEVLAALERHKVAVVSYTSEAEATEFRLSGGAPTAEPLQDRPAMVLVLRQHVNEVGAQMGPCARLVTTDLVEQTRRNG